MTNSDLILKSKLISYYLETVRGRNKNAPTNDFKTKWKGQNKEYTFANSEFKIDKASEREREGERERKTIHVGQLWFIGRSNDHARYCRLFTSVKDEEDHVASIYFVKKFWHENQLSKTQISHKFRNRKQILNAKTQLSQIWSKINC